MVKLKECDRCKYRINKLVIPRAGNNLFNEIGYATFDKDKREGIGFEFADMKLCPACYSKYCKEVRVSNEKV